MLPYSNMFAIFVLVVTNLLYGDITSALEGSASVVLLTIAPAR